MQFKKKIKIEIKGRKMGNIHLSSNASPFDNNDHVLSESNFSQFNFQLILHQISNILNIYSFQ